MDVEQQPVSRDFPPALPPSYFTSDRSSPAHFDAALPPCKGAKCAAPLPHSQNSNLFPALSASTEASKVYSVVPQQLPPPTTTSSSLDTLQKIEKEVSDGLSLAEALAELERVRQKNADLLQTISSLEARLAEREGDGTEGGDRIAGTVFVGSLLDGHSKQYNERDLCIKSAEMAKNEQMNCEVKHGEGVLDLVAQARGGCNGQGGAVTWMSKEELHLQDLERPERRNAESERDDSMESDFTNKDYSSSEEEEGNGCNGNNERVRQMEDMDCNNTETDDQGVGSIRAQLSALNAIKKLGCAQTLDEGDLMTSQGSLVGRDHGNNMSSGGKRTKRRKKKRKVQKKIEALNMNVLGEGGFSSEMIPYRARCNMPALIKKAPKSAFCPREVKRIMESGVLAFKNAQSHTMRKIIVFASLAIRHGCEDLYELDFNHFSIVKRGEPYVSAKDPGEHVLYDHPGIRKRIFYPNKQNPVLCPVCILDEERSMRPLGPSCPSCLFLCIKYGGKTRNLPQNEYVRQRMGRNKLKSFGPLMCQMALLVHIRTGGFFFKALGITLLFMAGFPGDLVRKETKYRNLDLLQKYYRSDEEAKGELLFHEYPSSYAEALMASPALPGKSTTGGSKTTGKKQPPPLLNKPEGSQNVAHFGLATSTLQGPLFPSPAFPPIAGFGPCPQPLAGSVCAKSGAALISVATSGLSPPYGFLPAYHMQCPAGPPMLLWPPLSSFPHGPFSSPSYAYQEAFSHASQYGSATYYDTPLLQPSSAPPSMNEYSEKIGHDSEEDDSDSGSSSSGASQ